MKRLAGSLGILLGLGLASASNALTITFDSILPPQIVMNDAGSLDTDGYSFTPTAGTANGYIIGGSYQPEGNPQGNQPLVNNGTPNLMCANWVNLHLAPTAGGPFDLASLELGGTFDQELVGRWSWASAVNIVGHPADGGSDLLLRVELNSDFALHLVTLGWVGLSSVDFLPEQSLIGTGPNDREFTLDNLAVSDPAAPTSVAPRESSAPGRLLSALPNPMRETSIIKCYLPETGEIGLKIVDTAGRLVRTLYSGWSPSGDRVIRWDGLDDRGAITPSGIYFIHLQAGRRMDRQTLIRIR